MTTHVRSAPRPLRRVLLLLGASLALLIMVGAPATALPPGGASPNTPGTSVTLSPTSLEAGDKISFRLRGFPAGETVNVKIDDGEECGEAAVHGACVVYKQRISKGSTIGSFKVPKDLKKGTHTLRFLASEDLEKDGKVVGTLGYTLRSPEFTIVAAEKSSNTTSTKTTTTTSESSAEPSSTASASASPTARASSTPSSSPSATKKSSKKKKATSESSAKAEKTTKAATTTTGAADSSTITPEPVTAVVTGAGLSVAQALGVGGGAVGIAALVGGLTAWWRRGP